MLFMAKSTMYMAMESSSQTASHDRRVRMRNEKQVASPQHFTSNFIARNLFSELRLLEELDKGANS